MSDLKFNRSLSIEGFKALHNLKDKITVRHNPATEKNFFTTEVSGLTGKVSTTWDQSKPSNISECIDDQGVVFWMLHNKTEATVLVEL